ncbi:YlbF family regulator [Bacillus sp. FJAT-44742]|uniref:YlbF family regulator n=1 Tax=Bacillus sp. FJAT-44742 TaxID=2014005 RepID=UPI000C24A0A6|nr:YlbF family regulator [Bacillus sp. FJAT-44742]
MTTMVSTPADVLAASAALGDLVIRSEVFQAYLTCKERMDEDSEAQELISRFTHIKEQYEEVQRFGKYHPDYKTVSTNVRQLKRQLDVNDSIGAFKNAEKELESLLNEISAEIGYAVSPNIKVPTGNPYFDNLSCGGGCGSGGSCGCG